MREAIILGEFNYFYIVGKHLIRTRYRDNISGCNKLLLSGAIYLGTHKRKKNPMPNPE